MFYNEVEIEVIKLAVCNIESVQLNSKQILLDSIVWLRESYERTEDDSYLKKAMWHIYTYLELGYPYDEGKVEFQKVLDWLKLDITTIFPEVRWSRKKIPLKKGNIRNILGKWNGTIQSMKINDVVADIIKNVSEQNEGEYLYHCGKEIVHNKDEKLWKHTFKLYVSSKETILHNINENKYYILESVKADD